MSIPIIEEQPTSLGSLASALGQGIGGGIQSSLEKFNQGKQINKAVQGLQPVLEQLGLPLESHSLSQILEAGVSPDNILNLAQNVHKTQQAQQQAAQKFQQSQIEGEKKQKEKEFERTQAGRTFSNIVEKMRDLKPYVGTTYIPFTKSAGGHISRTKAARKRAQVNTLRLSLEGLFRDLTAKGQFPKAIYERILENLPSAEDTEKQYEGRLDAIQQILDAHFGSQSGPTPSAPQITEKLSLEEIFS